MRLERGLWPEALVAALASLSVAWPLTTLLQQQSWVPLAIVMVAVVALTGAVLRSLGAPTAVVPLGQLGAAVIGLGLAYVPQTLWYGLPTLSSARSAAGLLGEAGSVLRTYAAPAPTTPGVAFLVIAVLLLAAVSVDAIGVTVGTPALAGVPLAAAFLVSVSNSGEAMDPWFFLATGGAWLLMLAQQGARLVDSWPSRGHRELAGNADDVSLGRTGHRSTARIVGAFALVAAVAGAGVVPHLPPTYFAQGLARNPDANDLGGGGGQVSFVDTMDPAADLRSQSDAPVLRYTSDARLLEPLKVTATSSYDDGRWSAPEVDPEELVDPPTRAVDGPQGLSARVQTFTRTIRVQSNQLQPPHLATPSPLTYLDAGADAWRYDPERGSAVLSDGPVSSYTANYVTYGSLDVLPEGIGVEPVPTGQFEQELEVPEEAQDAVSSLAAQVVGQQEAPLQQAILIQNHLRSGQYFYSLTLAPEVAGVPDEPISQFLASRQGYCVQFATAMVMMARDQGIPARMAVGFLPGTRQPGGTREVVASDAHTWPELYLDGLGWTRFEPTPGIRTGPAPEFTQNPVDVESIPTPSTAPLDVDPVEPAQDQDGSSPGEAFQEVLVRLGYVIAVLGVLAALMLVVPLAGRWYRRRDLVRAETPQDEVEAQWLLLTRSLSDLGIPTPEPRSPRAMREHYSGQVELGSPGADALGRVTQTLERVRYAPVRSGGDIGPEPTSYRPAVEDDVTAVVAAVREKVSGRVRMRATLLPRTGLTGLREWFRGGGADRSHGTGD